MKEERKNLRQVVEGFICKLILSGKSTLDSKKLNNALTDCKLLSGSHEERDGALDKVLCSLFMAHRIIPDVLNGKGFIITNSFGEHKEAMQQFALQTPIAYGSPILYTHDQAKSHLDKLKPETKQCIDELYSSYSTNRYDSREIFGL